jgi:hypothetical protein
MVSINRDLRIPVIGRILHIVKSHGTMAFSDTLPWRLGDYLTAKGGKFTLRVSITPAQRRATLR